MEGSQTSFVTCRCFQKRQQYKKGRRFELYDKTRSFALIPVSKYTIQQNNQPKNTSFHPTKFTGAKSNNSKSKSNQILH